MRAAELSRLRDYMRSHDIMFCFSGFMTEEVLTGISIALRKKLALEETDQRTMKGMFSVFVEMVQNVIRYSAETVGTAGEPDHPLRYGILSVGRRDQDQYFVACGNLVTRDDAVRLERDLTHIMSLDRRDLMSLYKRTLREKPPQGSKGAGVGFMEIARQVDHGFDYDFCSVDDRHTFFSLTAYL